MSITLWHGFQHSWSQTNHRANRLGSWVRGAGMVGHAGASGTGSDTLTYTDRYLALSVPGLSATYGSVQFDLKGTRGTAVDFKKSMTLAKDPGQGTVALLNGFDLCAVAEGSSDTVCAAKLRSFSMVVEGSGAGGAAQTGLSVSGSLNLDCKSTECCGGTGWHYTLVVYYVVLSATAGDVAWAPGSVVNANYSFNRATELTPPAVKAQVATLGGKLSFYASGLKAISLRADRDQPAGLKASTLAEGAEIAKSVTLGGADTAMHLLQLDLGMKDARCGATGTEFTPELYFKNWKPGMNVLGYRDGGTVTASLLPLNLGFLKGGSAKAGVNHGTMLWVGGNKVASGTEGSKEVKIPV